MADTAGRLKAFYRRRTIPPRVVALALFSSPRLPRQGVGRAAHSTDGRLRRHGGPGRGDELMHVDIHEPARDEGLMCTHLHQKTGRTQPPPRCATGSHTGSPLMLAGTMGAPAFVLHRHGEALVNKPSVGGWPSKRASLYQPLAEVASATNEWLRELALASLEFPPAGQRPHPHEVELGPCPDRPLTAAL